MALIAPAERTLSDGRLFDNQPLLCFGIYKQTETSSPRMRPKRYETISISSQPLHLGNSQIFPALQRDRDVAVRAMAAWALGQLEVVEAIAPLGDALGDESSLVRRRAATALGEIENESALAHLDRALRDTDAVVRRTAA